MLKDPSKISNYLESFVSGISDVQQEVKGEVARRNSVAVIAGKSSPTMFPLGPIDLLTTQLDNDNNVIDNVSNGIGSFSKQSFTTGIIQDKEVVVESFQSDQLIDEKHLSAELGGKNEVEKGETSYLSEVPSVSLFNKTSSTKKQGSGIEIKESVKEPLPQLDEQKQSGVIGTVVPVSKKQVVEVINPTIEVVQPINKEVYSVPTDQLKSDVITPEDISNSNNKVVHNNSPHQQPTSVPPGQPSTVDTIKIKPEKMTDSIIPKDKIYKNESPINKPISDEKQTINLNNLETSTIIDQNSIYTKINDNLDNFPIIDKETSSTSIVSKLNTKDPSLSKNIDNNEKLPPNLTITTKIEVVQEESPPSSSTLKPFAQSITSHNQITSPTSRMPTESNIITDTTNLSVAFVGYTDANELYNQNSDDEESDESEVKLLEELETEKQIALSYLQKMYQLEAALKDLKEEKATMARTISSLQSQLKNNVEIQSEMIVMKQKAENNDSLLKKYRQEKLQLMDNLAALRKDNADIKDQLEEMHIEQESANEDFSKLVTEYDYILRQNVLLREAVEDGYRHEIVEVDKIKSIKDEEIQQIAQTKKVRHLEKETQIDCAVCVHRDTQHSHDEIDEDATVAMIHKGLSAPLNGDVVLVARSIII